MIVNLLISVILGFISVVFTFLPVVTLADLPVIGSSISSILLTMVTTWNAFLVTFPFAVTPWHVFLGLVLVFEPLLLLAKFFLGHRLPANI